MSNQLKLVVLLAVLAMTFSSRAEVTDVPATATQAPQIKAPVPVKSSDSGTSSMSPASLNGIRWDGIDPKALNLAAKVEQRKHSLPRSMPAEIQ